MFPFDFISGVLLSSVVSLNPEKPPFMLILNAKTMEEIARAEVDASFHVCLHGYFIPQKESNWVGFVMLEHIRRFHSVKTGFLKVLSLYPQNWTNSIIYQIE